MGLFDKLKNINEPEKNNNQVNINPNIRNGIGFCPCGNTTYELYCRNCNKKILKNFSSNEYYDLFNNNIIIPLSSKYDVDFKEVSIANYFNLTSKQTEHVIYLLMHNIIFNNLDGDIINYFEDIIEETKNNGNIDSAFENVKIKKSEDHMKLDNVEKLILENIKQEIIDTFHNKGFKYNRTATVKSSQYETREIPIIKNKHGTITKGVATLGFGLLGFAATSGVETTMETKQIKIDGEYIHRQYLFNEKYISIKAFSDNLCANHFNSDNYEKVVIGWEDINYIDEDYSLILKSGDVIQIQEPVFDEMIYKNIFKVVGIIGENNNYFLKVRYIDKFKEILPNIFYDLLNNYINKNNDLIMDTSDSEDNPINELEKLSIMYEKGLLTDDEFTTMKQNIIAKNTTVENNNDVSAKFCGNCGMEIAGDSKFCSHCGTKLN